MIRSLLLKHLLFGLFVFAVLVFECEVVQAQADLDATGYVISGRVTDNEGQPLAFATLRIEDGPFTVTDEEGFYSLALARRDYRAGMRLRLEIRHISMQPQSRELQLPADRQSVAFDIRLKNRNLYLDEVTVTARTSEASVSNSTYVIDRVAIEQSQAFSLSDVLQLIPGQNVQNPQLQGAQTINFRSVLPSQFSNNNAFGIGIFLNDNNLNNNANMQGYNPATNGRFRSFGSARVNSNSFAGGDTPGSGFDLRALPVGDVERIEVVQGVASARYGDILEGGIFIETVAGSSPWEMNLRRTGGNTNVGLNKGFKLHNRHALNISLDYLNSNSDPRDQVKTFNRLSSSLLWTAYLGDNRQLKNTLSVSYRTNLDDFRIDPDFGTERRVYYQNQNLSVSNRTTLQSSSLLFNNMTFSISANTGRSVSYLNQFVNPGVLPVTGVTEEGVSVGTYHPSSYRTTREILGQPFSMNARLQFNRVLTFGDWKHNISYGANTSFDANYGEGRVFDPLRPIRFGGATLSERPVSYRELNPAVWQGGAWLENSIGGELLGRELNASLGLRGDLQNGYSSLSPRLNARMQLTEKWSLTGGYGLQVKAPGLLHLFPGPDFEDYTLINSFNGNVSESLYLTYTRVSTDASENLRPMKSQRMEVGLRFSGNDLRVNATVFRNISRDGITVQQDPRFLDVPLYEIVARPEGQQPIVAPTGDTQRIIYAQGQIINALYSRNWGVEVTANSSRIEAIRTSFSLNLAYNQSYYFNGAQNVSLVGRDPQPEEEIWYGIYPPRANRAGRTNAMLTSMHHLSELGLLLTLRTEAFLYNFSEVIANSNRATAYINNALEVVSIPVEQLDDPRFDVLDQTPINGSFNRDPSFVYFNMHANVSKEISEQFRLSFFANNIFNLRPRVIDAEGNLERLLNQEPFFGMEMRLKL